MIKFNLSFSKYLRLFAAAYLILSNFKIKASGDFVFINEASIKI